MASIINLSLSLLFLVSVCSCSLRLLFGFVLLPFVVGISSDDGLFLRPATVFRRRVHLDEVLKTETAGLDGAG